MEVSLEEVAISHRPRYNTIEDIISDRTVLLASVCRELVPRNYFIWYRSRSFHIDTRKMKFGRKSKKTTRSSDHSRRKRSNRDLSIKTNEVKNSKKKFSLAFIKNLTWYKKRDLPIIKSPLITPSSIPSIEDLEKEFMFMLKKINNRFKIHNNQRGEQSFLINHHNLNNLSEEYEGDQMKFYAKERLLITRSIDNFARISRKQYPYPSFSSPFVYQPLLKNTARRASQSDLSLTVIPRCRTRKATLPSESINNNNSLPSNLSIKSESCLKKQKSSINDQLSLHGDEKSLESTSKHCQSHDAAIIDVEHESYLSLNKSLEKSSSSPLPMNTNHSSINHNPLQSAHLIDQCSYENKNAISLYSCVSEMGDDQSTESISSDEETVKHRLLQYNKENLRHRWSLLDIWDTTMARLPPVLNHIWRKRLRCTGSKEYLLEYDQMLSTNNNNNNRANVTQEQRYVEQERPIHAHIGLALLALLIFPPIGMIAFLLSVWSLCGQQDRHLSRKFGNAVYWISLLAISLSFLLLLTLFTYFTYRYLTHQSTFHY